MFEKKSLIISCLFNPISLRQTVLNLIMYPSTSYCVHLSKYSGQILFLFTLNILVNTLQLAFYFIIFFLQNILSSFNIKNENCCILLIDIQYSTFLIYHNLIKYFPFNIIEVVCSFFLQRMQSSMYLYIQTFECF